jgi:translation elongation factor EF-G
MGELHLDIIVDRLRASTASTRTSAARRSSTARRWPSRPTARRASSASSRTRRCSATRACTSRRAPRRGGNVLRMELVEAGAEAGREDPETPQAILDAAMEGAREAMHSGPQGYPIEDIEVVITAIEYRRTRPRQARQAGGVYLFYFSFIPYTLTSYSQ